ncbi:hypothetical protein KTO58_19320 [Chitinophaga pendula]|uniref:hypothetical protein n=1 Tax=Chitinophaga TaxID=79328 RepID=UPI000BB0752E|nr:MULTISPECIES: hypothetical protein [Chitinophaga]ASZ11177.1 hypothetical protein CK934_09485 [Chitinophaga sp. MD30]UCJ05826.1 hypothetical protein KTO58_19320 [Chitinophaga pendula]
MGKAKPLKEGYIATELNDNTLNLYKDIVTFVYDIKKIRGYAWFQKYSPAIARVKIVSQLLKCSMSSAQNYSSVRLRALTLQGIAIEKFNSSVESFLKQVPSLQEKYLAGQKKKGIKNNKPNAQMLTDLAKFKELPIVRKKFTEWKKSIQPIYHKRKSISEKIVNRKDKSIEDPLLSFSFTDWTIVCSNEEDEERQMNDAGNFEADSDHHKAVPSEKRYTLTFYHISSTKTIKCSLCDHENGQIARGYGYMGRNRKLIIVSPYATKEFRYGLILDTNTFIDVFSKNRIGIATAITTYGDEKAYKGSALVHQNLGSSIETMLMEVFHLQKNEATIDKTIDVQKVIAKVFKWDLNHRFGKSYVLAKFNGFGKRLLESRYFGQTINPWKNSQPKTGQSQYNR